jgi:hypothetical protein
MRIFGLLLLLGLFCACSKERKTIRKASGNWELISYKFILPNGLTYYEEATGKLELEKYNPKNDPNGTYSFSITNSITNSETGKYFYDKKENQINVQKITTDNQLKDTLPFKTNALLKDHIILERIRDGVIYTYTFKKLSN